MVNEIIDVKYYQLLPQWVLLCDIIFKGTISIRLCLIKELGGVIDGNDL